MWLRGLRVLGPSCAEASLLSTTDPVVQIGPGGVSFLPGKVPFIDTEGNAADVWTRDVAQAHMALCADPVTTSISFPSALRISVYTDGNGPEKHFSSRF